MEIMVCEKCGSMNTSEDMSTREHTCLKCGHVAKGKSIDFFGVTSEKERPVNPNRREDPFKIQTRIRSTRKLI